MLRTKYAPMEIMKKPTQTIVLKLASMAPSLVIILVSNANTIINETIGSKKDRTREAKNEVNRPSFSVP